MAHLPLARLGAGHRPGWGVFVGRSKSLQGVYAEHRSGRNIFGDLSVEISMNDTVRLPDSTTGLLSNRLFSLASRIEEIDPQLSRVLVPWVVRHPRYLPGFLRPVSYTHLDVYKRQSPTSSTT